MLLSATYIIPTVLWKIQLAFGLFGSIVSHAAEYVLEVIVGIDFSAFGSDILSVHYQWMMVFALPVILSYNYKQGKKFKYFFYLFYPLHIILSQLLAS